MPAIKNHDIYVEEGSTVAVQIGTGSKSRVGLDTFQAKCECSWHGPVRTRQWEAEDDVDEHCRNPYET